MLRSFVPALAFSVVATMAMAAQPGTTGTEKSYQQQALRSTVLTQPNVTGTAVAGAVTVKAAGSGVITSEALTTAAAGDYTLTITNPLIVAADVVLASVANGSNTQGVPVLRTVKPGNGSVVIVVRNFHASEALNGTLKISFLVIKQSPNGRD